jgi:hypothetical protein
MVSIKAIIARKFLRYRRTRIVAATSGRGLLRYGWTGFA